MIVDELVIGVGSNNDSAWVERRQMGSRDHDGDYDILEVYTLWEYVDQYGVEGVGEPYPDGGGDPLDGVDLDMRQEAIEFLDRYPYDVTKTKEFSATPISRTWQRGPNDTSGYERDCREHREQIRDMIAGQE